MRIAPSVAPWFCAALSALAGTAFCDDAAPPLPPGLEGTGGTESPALPPGLESDVGGSGPALPEGLAPGPGDATPALPPGLAPETAEGAAAGQEEKARLRDRLPFPVYGFVELRGGVRTQPDAAEPSDAVLGELRLQLETKKAWQKAVFEFTGDIYGDAVLEEGAFDLRKLRLTWTPLNSVDIRAGRQVLTWGTGDMLFINDLFPKDWPSFFSGRDVEYLKAPSDSLRVGWFTSAVNVDFVYTPQFAPDRFITGERISYWNPLRQGHSGEHDQVNFNVPSTWFQEDEWALRLYRSIGSAEAALYTYSGYWKSPGGQRFIPMQATFPKLRVYGASLRGPVGKGIANVEAGYYDSYQDDGGDNPLINNSEFRLLLGYERELAKELTGAVQYYLEHMVDYDAYKRTRIFLMPLRDENRHVLTARLTKLLMNQTLVLSLFAYYSPSDSDAYLRPKVTYKASDQWTLEVGGNVFLGASDTSFFGQFQDNTNVYAGLRYAF